MQGLYRIPEVVRDCIVYLGCVGIYGIPEVFWELWGIPGVCRDCLGYLRCVGIV